MLMRAALGFAVLIFFESGATAQSVSKDRLNDWEFRFYACKNVVMNAVIVARLMAKHKITDQSGIEELHSQLGPTMAEAVKKHEKEYQFIDGEAQFVSDLTFSVVTGMVQGGFELSETQLINSGSNICIHTIESVAQ